MRDGLFYCAVVDSAIIVMCNFLTLVVQSTIPFIRSFITQVIKTGTSSDLSWKVWVTAYKGDAY